MHIMALPAHLAPRTTQITVPVGPDGRWVDSGEWRERGVTHWHLVRRDWARKDGALRFDNERALADRHRPSHGVAKDPFEVCDWLLSEALRAVKELPDNSAAEMLQSSGLDTEDGRRLKDEIRFYTAMTGKDVFGMIGLGPARIADLTAYAMTASSCKEH